jgi:hypothetical protein
MQPELESLIVRREELEKEALYLKDRKNELEGRIAGLEKNSRFKNLRAA